MVTTIKAIETEYAGCRFRSRLEARWAVFFDHLSIRWNYEPEGIDIDGMRYLPDFQLPDLAGLYIEVKGVMDKRGMEKVLRLAAAGHGVMVVRDIPRPDDGGPHFLLYGRIREQVARWSVSFFTDSRGGSTIQPFGWPQREIKPDDPEHVAEQVDAVNKIGTFGDVMHPLDPMASAFGAARSARFDGRN